MRRKPMVTLVLLTVPTLIAVAVAIVLMSWRVGTRVRLELTVDRVVFTLGGVDPNRILNEVGFESLTVEKYSLISFEPEPTELEIADPDRYDEVKDSYPDSAWEPLELDGAVTIKGERPVLQPSVTFKAENAGTGKVDGLWARPGSQITLELQGGEGSGITIGVEGEKPSSVVLSFPGVFELITNYSQLSGIRKLPYQGGSLSYRMRSEGRGNRFVEITSEPHALVIIVTLPVQKTRDIFSRGGIPITAIDFTRQNPQGEPEATLIRGGKITYPEYPQIPAVSFSPPDFVSLGGLEKFSIDQIALGNGDLQNSNRTGIRLRLDGIVSGVGTGSARFPNDHRLTRFDVLWQDWTLTVLFSIVVWVFPTTIGAWRLWKEQARMTRALKIVGHLFLFFVMFGDSVLRAQTTDPLKAGVVKIRSKGKTGTGFIAHLTPDAAYIVTASHVVEGDKNPEVEFFTRRNIPVRARAIGLEGGDSGLALLLVVKDNLPPNLSRLRLGTSVPLSGGDDVVVIGFPLLAGPWSVIRGSVASRRGREIILDARIDEGNSGGPVIKNDQVVGLVTGVGRFGVAVPALSVQLFLEGYDVRPAGLGSASPPPPASLPRNMVKIPAGDFWMGCNEKVDSKCDDDEKSGRKVYLDAFFIDKHEVTVRDYRRCVNVGKCSVQGLTQDGSCNWDKSGRENHPINCVDWSQAEAYCKWVGKRLPTEAEWEKAARGTDGRTYPWGNNWDSTRANVGSKGTVVVGSLSGASPYGAHDMAGNVWEWVSDWYDSGYYQAGGTKNPKGPPKGDGRVVRGGSWFNNPRSARTSLRLGSAPEVRYGLLGFRCAQ